MHNQLNGRRTQTAKRWKLTLFAEDTSPTVVTGLSNDQMRRAVSAVMTGDDGSLEQVTGERSAAPIERAA
jgi:hypothetical protein